MSEIIFMAQEPPEGGFAAEALGYRYSALVKPSKN
jgi:hypothetical protein